jgi:hypothetical protein
MILGLILLSVCNLLAPIGAFFMFKRYLDHKQAAVEAQLRAVVLDWIQPTEDGKQSKFAEMLDAGGAIVGRAAAKSIMLQLNQANTSVTQTANGIADPLEAHSNPIAALMSGGKRGKGAALARLAQLLAPMLTGSTGSNSNHGEHGAPSKGSPFSL